MKTSSLSLSTKLTLAAFAILAAIGVTLLFTAVPSGPAQAQCSVTDEALQSIVPITEPAPVAEMSFIAADGSEINLSDFRGRGVVLNFWATWCAPCVREMPELDRIKAVLEPDGIDVLAASTDRAGHSAILGFYEKTGIQNLAALHDPKGVAARAAGARGLPTTLIIDRSGNEVARISGIHHYDTPETIAYLRDCLTSG